MPNHVENHLTFDCSEERLKEILQAIGRDEDSALDGQYGIGTFDFNKVIPMPDDIYRGDLGPKEQKIYGKKNWYDWSCWNWGTKWNSYGNSFDGHTLTFQTAWAAPPPVIEKLSEMYPDVTISHRWADEDLGCNCGERDYRNGEITHEYIPDLQTDAMNLSLSVWGYEPEDMGLALNATGTAYINTDMKEYELIELFGKPALFSNERLTKEDIPEGLYCYDLRESDDGEHFATLEPKVTVNHGGSVVTDEPIDFEGKDHIALTEDTSPNFMGQDISFGQYMTGDYDTEMTMF